MRPRSWRSASAALAMVLAAFATGPVAAQTLVWMPQGPAPNTKGQVEGIADGVVVGAIQAVAPHPKNANIIYIAAVNGGVWRTRNGTATSPSWQALTDSLGSLSMGALAFDPTDATHQ